MTQQKIKIILNSNFYDKRSIKEALKDYKGICTGKILNDKFDVELNSNEHIDNLEGEFCNYVLGLIKHR